MEASSQRPRVPEAAVRSLLAANREVLASHTEGALTLPAPGSLERLILTETGDDWSAGWFVIPGPWKRLRGLVTPSGALTLADTTFIDPAMATTALKLADGETLPHHRALLPCLGGDDPVALHSRLKREVMALLAEGQPEQLGAGLSPGERTSPWHSGAYLFTTPAETALHPFSVHNPVQIRFLVPRDLLFSWLAIGLIQINAMISDAGAPLDPDARLGSPDAALEVVAIGHEGVYALWQRRVT